MFCFSSINDCNKRRRRTSTDFRLTPGEIRHCIQPEAIYGAERDRSTQQEEMIETYKRDFVFIDIWWREILFSFDEWHFTLFRHWPIYLQREKYFLHSSLIECERRVYNRKISIWNIHQLMDCGSAIVCLCNRMAHHASYRRKIFFYS